jgi:hypothetical protein
MTKGGEERVTSPLANTGLSHFFMQSTKHEHTNSGYLYSTYQTRAICTILDMLGLAWLESEAKLELPRLSITPIGTCQAPLVTLMLPPLRTFSTKEGGLHVPHPVSLPLHTKPEG